MPPWSPRWTMAALSVQRRERHSHDPHAHALHVSLHADRIHEGYVIGKERILTNRSGLFGWATPRATKCMSLMTPGRKWKVSARHTVRIDRKTFTELRIAEGWSAAIVKR